MESASLCCIARGCPSLHQACAKDAQANPQADRRLGEAQPVSDCNMTNEGFNLQLDPSNVVGPRHSGLHPILRRQSNGAVRSLAQTIRHPTRPSNLSIRRIPLDKDSCCAGRHVRVLRAPPQRHCFRSRCPYLRTKARSCCFSQDCSFALWRNCTFPTRRAHRPFASGSDRCHCSPFSRRIRNFHDDLSCYLVLS
jgi:hypothetical protein